MFFEIEFDKSLSSNGTIVEASSAHSTTNTTTSSHRVKTRNEKDYYGILGIDKSSTIEDVKKSFKRLAVKYHPDKNPGNKETEERFKDLSEAYDVLGHKHRKFRYDEYGITEVVSKWFPGQISDKKFIIVTSWLEDEGWLVEKIEWLDKGISVEELGNFENIITRYFNNLPKVGTFTAEL